MAAALGSSTRSFLGSEFDAFLFAPIGEDGNGTLLSVLSALARLDLDPWQEAAKLARLPGATATERLASLIASLPAGSGAPLDPGVIAIRLIALLPHRILSTAPALRTLAGGGTAVNYRLVIFLVLMALTLGVQYIIANRQPPAHVDGARPPLSSGDFPHLPPPSSGQ
jgi:hypothetical protein